VSKRKIKFDNASTEVEVDEPVAALFEQAQAKRDAAEKALKTDAEQAKAKLDSAEKQIADLTKQLAEAPAKALEAAKSRAALESVAKEHMGESKFDGLDDNAVRLAVIEKLTGEKFSGKSAEYVAARFDCEVAAAAKVNPGLASARAASTPRADAVIDPIAKAKAEFAAALAK
jgi:DNA-binding protein H-NS